jgi:hypothetical protein
MWEYDTKKRNKNYILPVNDNSPNKRNTIKILTKYWVPNDGSYLTSASAMTTNHSIMLLDDNEVIKHFKKPDELNIVIAVKRSHVELYNLEKQIHTYHYLSQICNYYERVNYGKRYCMKCFDFHDIEHFYKSSNYCKNYVNSEVEYQIHLLRRNHHHKDFKDGCYYNIKRRKNETT